MDPIIDPEATTRKNVVKPTRQAGIISVVMGVCFLVFGGAMFILIGQDEGVEMAVLVLFGIFWAIVCLGIIVAGALSMRKGGLAMIRVERDTDPAGASPEREDPMDRLRKLEGLRKEGLIDAAEFKAKREELMRRKW